MLRSRNRIPVLAGLALCGLVAVAHAWPSLETTVDDAWISARYAWHFAEGHGLVYNAGEPPVEGYTNLLWVLWLAFAHLIGLPIHGAMTWGGLACALVGLGMALGLTRQLAGRWHPVLLLAPLGLALSPHYVVAATNGIETSMFTAGLLGITWAALAARTPGAQVAVGAGLMLLGMVRPEGSVVAVLLSGWALLVGRGVGRFVLPLSAGLGQVGILVWRLLTYGDIVPNTFHAKSNLELSRVLELNAKYLGMDGPYWYVVGLVLLLSVVLSPRRLDRVLLAVVAVTLAVVALRVHMWMPAARLFVPILALTLCSLVAPLAAVDSGRSWRPWVAGALLVGCVGLAFSPIGDRVRAYDRRHSVLAENPAALAARHLAQHAPEGSWLAVRDAGVVAYHASPRIRVAELHDRALTLPHPDGEPLDLALIPLDPEIIVLTQAREKAEGFRYKNDQLVFERAEAGYTYLGRVYQHRHRYYDFYVREDVDVPPLPSELVVNFAGPRKTAHSR